MPQYPPLPIVNANDEIVGEAYLEDIYDKGYYHRGALVIVRDADGRVLLQRRGPDVLASPNRWDVSASGHVDKGESYSQAAERELGEELGIGADLTEVAYYRSETVLEGRKLNRFLRIYTATVPGDTEFTIDTDELTGIRWIAAEELKSELASNPEEFIHDCEEVFKQAGILE